LFRASNLYAPLAPNATLQAPLEAGATKERTLEAVACKRLFGLALRVDCSHDDGLAPHQESLVMVARGFRWTIEPPRSATHGTRRRHYA
jgi:hypothetical protein